MLLDEELLLYDRLEIIRNVITKYGEENFYLSFSGGKDSTVLHYLIDEALPGNMIPRVFCNTGIEYQMIVDFVKSMQQEDSRIVIIKPSRNIHTVLKESGYPFKSKEHSHVVAVFQHSGMGKTVNRYLNDKRGKFHCPNILRYQFKSDFQLKISEKCCKVLKKDRFESWQKENRRPITITGMMAEEKGLRESIKGCIITDKTGGLKKFHPLLKVTQEWEEWYINARQIKLCELYYEPFCFKRTGCKGCPYSLDLQMQLTTMALLLPKERAQCELIWKPVYDEYRKLGYRLTKHEKRKLF